MGDERTTKGAANSPFLMPWIGSMMALRAFASAGFIALSGLTAVAQNTTDAMLACAKVTANDERLKCFDKAVADVTHQTPAPVRNDWALDESNSLAADSARIAGAMLSEDRDSSLVLRCQDKKIEALFVQKELFASERALVTLRQNDTAPITTWWRPSSDNRAAAAPNAVQFIESLKDDGKLFIRTVGWKGRTTEATFHLNDVSKVKERVFAACR